MCVFNDGYFAMKMQLFLYQNTEHLLKGFSVTITYMNLLFQYPNIRLPSLLYILNYLSVLFNFNYVLDHLIFILELFIKKI